MQSTRVRAALAEFIGTFMLVFLAVYHLVFRRLIRPRPVAPSITQ